MCQNLPLYQLLLQETEEEKALLSSNNKVKQELYTDRQEFIIESQKFLNEDNMINVRKHTRFVDFPRHRHDYIEINYVYSGKLEQKVGNEQIVLQKGELLLLNQYIEHEIKACKREDIVINFTIQPKFFDFIFSYLTANDVENKIGDFIINSLFKSNESGQFLYFAVSEVESIQQLVHKIIHEIMEPSILSQTTTRLYMGLLIIELIKHSDRLRKQQEAFIQQHIIAESLKYIEENFKEASLTELANKLNQTDYSLSKNIKKVTSKTFKELLQEKRLKRASELLVVSEIPISTIVEQIGYDNISYFYRIFKKKYGKTPT